MIVREKSTAQKVPKPNRRFFGSNSFSFRAYFVFLLSFFTVSSLAQKIPEDIPREVIAPLIDPVKVATLKGDRPANARLYKVLYWLETARRDGVAIGETIDKAQAHLQIEKTKGAAADRKAFLWAHEKLIEFGCFDAAGMKKLRGGGSPEMIEP